MTESREMDKSIVWAKCLTTTHCGMPCGEDCLIQQYVEEQLKQSVLEQYLRTEVYTTNVTHRYTVNKVTGEVYTIDTWNM